MGIDFIHDRGRGPEIVGTRITVYNLLPHFFDPTATEDFICRFYDLTPEQVAAARAYALNNAETVLARHFEIEEKIAAGNPPEVVEQATRTRDALLKFKAWRTKREQAETAEQQEASLAEGGPGASSQFPTYREWLAEQEAQSAQER